jgi:hypothetical protein
VHSARQAGHHLSCAYRIWSGWPEEEQKRFTSILFLYSRTFTYEWDWEEFIVHYMIFDACWKMGRKLFGLKSKNHEDRINVLCNHFSLTHTLKILNIPALVDLRNDLLHEGLWFKGRPGATFGNLPYHIPTTMGHHLNAPLIAAFLGLQTRDRSTPRRVL